MDGELIDKIVRQVLETLGGKAGGANLVSAPVKTSPPAATASAAIPCALNPTSSKTNSGQPGQSSRRIFITAQMLQERLAGGTHGGHLELEHNEFLTPNAQDLAYERSLVVRRQSEPLPMAASIQSAADAGPSQKIPTPGGSSARLAVGLVLDRPDQKVQTAISALRHDGLVVESFNRTDCVLRNTTGLCEEISAGRTGAGVIIAPFAADLVMLANKFAGVRAVQGSRPESVSAAVKRFGANLLVVEYAFATFHEIRTMISLFAKRRRTPPADATLMQAVEKLERRTA